MQTLSALIPAAQQLAGNHFAAHFVIDDVASKCGSMANMLSFIRPMYQDAKGNQFCWCQLQVLGNWQDWVRQPVKAMEHDTKGEIDLKAVQSVQDGLTILKALPAPDEALPAITSMVLYEGTGLPEALGLTRMADE